MIKILAKLRLLGFAWKIVITIIKRKEKLIYKYYKECWSEPIGEHMALFSYIVGRIK